MLAKDAPSYLLLLLLVVERNDQDAHHHLHLLVRFSLLQQLPKLIFLDPLADRVEEPGVVKIVRWYARHLDAPVTRVRVRVRVVRYVEV